MIKSYFKIAWRNLYRDKLNTLVNVFGLSLGLTCSLMIWLWVKDELSFDKFISNVEQVHIVRVNYETEGGVSTGMMTNAMLADVLAQEVPEVKYAVKTQYPEKLLLKADGKSIKENGFYASQDFFKVFDLPVVNGDPDASIRSRDKIVITERTAEKLFGSSTDALGKSLQLNSSLNYTVGSVIKNIPGNATVQFDWVANYDVQVEDWKKEWGNSFCFTYVLLDPKASVNNAEANMKDIFSKYTNWDNAKGIHPVLQPLSDAHLYGTYENGQPAGGKIIYVRVFIFVAVFILLLACINFVNLSTARAATRTKEVGIRKVVGSSRFPLIIQFITESIGVNLLAVVLAIAFISVFLPTFNSILDKQIAFSLADPVLWIAIAALVLVAGLLCGIYPALFLSSVQPIRILKGTLNPGAGPARFRKSLVVFQFTMSIFLIMVMIIVTRQMEFVRTKDLGQGIENVLYIPLEGEIINKLETFRTEVTKSGAVVSAAYVMNLPIDISGTSSDLNWSLKEAGQQINVSAMAVGFDFIKTMNIKVKQGREFSKDVATDATNYIINESMAKLLGFKDPVGEEVTFWNGKGTIIGVMEDFHFQSLHKPISPLILCFRPENASYLVVRAEAGKTVQALHDIEATAKAFNPNYPFEFYFLDEAYAKLYQDEQRINNLVNYFTALAIVISCLGLFAFVTFTAEQKTKEIGVRKVLGASVSDIISLLVKGYLQLIMIALVIASALAIWIMGDWLQTFEYRTELAWWIFAIAGILVTAIAFLTAGYQTIKAALANPAKSLRAE